MIDLHAHVLPGLDDGPKSPDESYAVLRQAMQDGTDTLVTVAHANDNHFEVGVDAYRQVFDEFSAMVTDDPLLHVRLVPAMEVRLSPTIVEGFQQGRFLPIGDSRYACIELPPNDFPSYTLDMLYALSQWGLRILLIHPERNRGIRRRPELARRLIDMEILGVASAGSLLGQFGPEVEASSVELIEAGLIQAVASDGHSVVKRPLRLSPVRELLSRRYGEEAAHWMMEEVPQRVLGGLPIALRGRQPIGWRRWLVSRRI